MGLLVVMGVDLCDLSLGRTMIQRIALYATLGYTLDYLGAGVATLGFWCVVGLFWGAEALTRRELIEQLNEELRALREQHGIKDKE